MSLLFIACGLVALVLPGVRVGAALRGHPHWFARLDAVALLLGLVAILLGLGLSVGVGAVHLAAGTSLWRYEGHLAPGGIVASAASTLLVGYVVWRLVAVGRHARQALVVARADGWLGHHERRDGHEVVVVPTDTFVAYAVDGSPPQIVISEGLRARLDPEMVGFVIEHERAHLRHRHRRYLLIAVATEALFGAIPPVARSTLALRLAVERAADEDAAGADRHQRDRAGAGLERLCAVGFDIGCAPEALLYRAHRLLGNPAPRPAHLELLAGGGLLALSLLTVAVAAHATGDMPALLGLLRK